jgi:hypothetical protein
MKSHTKHNFFYKQNLESYYRLGSLGTVYDTALEIKYSKTSIDLYRYSSWGIQCIDLAKKVVHKHGGFTYSVFTEKSWMTIERFVKAAVWIYNKSHSSQQTTAAHALSKLKEWWDSDYEE